MNLYGIVKRFVPKISLLESELEEARLERQGTRDAASTAARELRKTIERLKSENAMYQRDVMDEKKRNVDLSVLVDRQRMALANDNQTILDLEQTITGYRVFSDAFDRAFCERHRVERLCSTEQKHCLGCADELRVELTIEVERIRSSVQYDRVNAARKILQELGSRSPLPTPLTNQIRLIEAVDLEDSDPPTAEDEIAYEREHDALLEIFKIAFDDKHKHRWFWTNGTAVFSAPLLDEEFRARVDRREVAFRHGDVFRVRLFEQIWRKADGRLKTLYEVRRVLGDAIERHEQLELTALTQPEEVAQESA